MELLGLDMSTKKTGYAIFSGTTLKKYGLIKSDLPDMADRIWEMAKDIQKIIKEYKINTIAVEDVPVSVSTNLQTAKCLLLLQGFLRYMCEENNIQIKLYKPTEWRKIVRLNQTSYICVTCGHTFTVPSDTTSVKCEKCGNARASQFVKQALNSREELKQRAVNLANELYKCWLQYYKSDTKKHISEDDVAEAILIATACLKGEK